MFKTILKPFASLTLTVILLGLSMVLIYAGTWAQIDSGIWQVQAKYFHSFFCWIDFQTLLPRPKEGQVRIPGGFPMLGGYTIGSLLLINLIAAHTVRFKFTAKRIGIITIHLGLILLLVGEGISSGTQSEAQMSIPEGSYGRFAQDIRYPELAVVEESPGDQDDVHTVVAARMLRNGAQVSDPRIPFDIKIDEFYNNSDFVFAETHPGKPTTTDDKGREYTAVEKPVFGGTEGSAVDAPAAFVTLSKNGKPLGSHLLHVYLGAHHLDVDGKSYTIALRFKRDYKPYTIYLEKFNFDRYTGSGVARNFAANIKLVDKQNNETRDVKIWMNHPLRYRGETIYQQGYDPRTEKGTVLQIVSNPGANLPYLAVLIAGFGLLDHFVMVLCAFLLRRSLTRTEILGGHGALVGLFGLGFAGYFLFGMWGIIGTAALVIAGVLALIVQHVATRESHTLTRAAAAAGLARDTKSFARENRKVELAPEPRFFTARFLLPVSLLAFCLVYVLTHALPHPVSDTYDYETFGKIPISFEGRVQPMDTLARNALKVMRGRESALLVEGTDKDRKETTIKPIVWLLDVLGDREVRDKYKVFRIDHPDVKGLAGLNDAEKFFSTSDLAPAIPKLIPQFQQAEKAQKADSKNLSQYQKALLELHGKLSLQSKLATLGQLYVAPPLKPGDDWQPLIDVAQATRNQGTHHPVAEAFLRATESYGRQQPAEFNRDTRAYAQQLEQLLPADAARSSFEAWFNHFDPFSLAMVFYVGVFVFAALSWLGWSVPLARAAFWLLCLTLVIHTFGLIARVYMSGRPPVTNLASSAIFIGWGAAVFAAILELIFRNGIGSVAAAVVGFPTLLIANRLALSGDTMAVLVAVLDTNIWLATHVIVITLGYAATFLAWMLGLTFVITGVFTPHLTPDLRKTLTRMIYGVTCFAMICSFVGTILGGIWADQSWGRFWGWDPKENGAVLIVLANALVLHARWGGLVKDRGIANLAIFGGIVTSWSWFGTNMLGVGLHSYGFMDSALTWLLIFVASQAALILVGLIPVAHWQSFRETAKPK